MQFEDHVALFYQGSFTGAREVAICLNATSTERPCPPTDDALFLHTSSAIIDFTFARGVQIGIGGSMALAHFATDHASTNVRAGYLFRAGYAFGGDGPGARQGFTIGFQGSLSVVVEGERPGPLVDLAVSLGWESF